MLELTGTLNHRSANLNHLAKKSSSLIKVLTTMDFLVMKWLSDELKETAFKIKKSLLLQAL
ncbi:MAG: hypothetical protein ABI091_00715 [Ferruginibacter sp.]